MVPKKVLLVTIAEAGTHRAIIRFLGAGVVARSVKSMNTAAWSFSPMWAAADAPPAGLHVRRHTCASLLIAHGALITAFQLGEERAGEPLELRLGAPDRAAELDFVTDSLDRA